MTSLFRLLLAATFSSALLLTGCSADFGPSPVQSPVGMIQGRVHGGQPAVSGAHVYLLQTNAGTYAGPGIAASTANASISLLSNTGNSDSIGSYVLTDGNGGFTFSDNYTCTAGSVVYLYALGGNAGGGTNSAIGMMAVLGACPAGGGSLASTVPFVWMNEVTTIAAAYSLAGFATDATHISAGSSTLSATGIQNAGSTAANLAVVTTGVAQTTTAGSNGTVPTATINTLANILASCVNATDAAFANCTTLFGAALSGGTTGSTPTDTATAAINMAHNPMANVATLYGLQAGVSSPFQTALSVQPTDLTIGLIFTGGGMVKPTYITPRTLSIDAAGNLWNANYVATGGSISEFSNLGVPLSGTTGFTGNGLASPFSTAVDTSNPALILVANEGGVVLSEFTSAGAAATGSPFTPSTALSQPVDAEFDGSGNIWVANLGGFLTKMTSAGVFTSKSATTDLSSPYGIAIGAGAAGNIWVGNSGTNSTGKDATVYTNANVFSAFSATTYHTEGGIAIDSAGTAWVAQYEKYLTKITAPGATVVTYQPGAAQYYIPELDSPMVDGGGNIWVSDFDDGCIYEVSNSGATLSGSFGFIAIGNSGYVAGKAPTTLVTEPNSLALDGSGNVWYTTTSDATIREIVGAAVPVATPTSYAVANSMLGTRP